MLRVATDFDILSSQGNTPREAVAVMRGQAEAYDSIVLEALAELHGSDLAVRRIRELPLAALEVGMVLAEDVHLTIGTLLAARGYEITLGFVERARNFNPGMVNEPVRVILRTA